MMTKKQLRRLRKMKEIEKENAEVKPDYDKEDNFWDFTKKIDIKKYKQSIKDDGLADNTEARNKIMSEMRTIWANQPKEKKSW
ncbi:MAG: hypothetical protein KF802_02685 [Bdellovibrionaceae bacterium]|nr:hypothetical protein [Pseudobdellovibrionaceae bacterium]